MILAAGMGSRYGGLKQMDAMGPNGETVLDYSVFDAIRAGFGKVVFIIRKDFEAEFKEKIGSRFEDKIAIDYAFQDLNDLPEGFSLPEGRTKPWGTTHAMLAARDVINEPFAVVNADDFYGADSFNQISKYLETSEDGEKFNYSMVGYPLRNTLSDHGDVNRGICRVENGLLNYVEEHEKIKRDEDGQVRGFNQAGEKVDLDENAYASMNFWGFTPSIFDALNAAFVEFLKERGTEMKSECYIPTVVDQLISSGKADAKVLDTTSSWFGVTYPDDKPKCVESIRQLIDSGAYPSSLV